MDATPVSSATPRCSECGWGDARPLASPLGPLGVVSWPRLVGLLCTLALGWWVWSGASSQVRRSTGLTWLA
ncbi:MAG: hypothetical protein SGJ09_03530 [Phycisphaerae bacterium]|nr:hypothetical protein [Phycisphaerae bacterium]